MSSTCFLIECIWKQNKPSKNCRTSQNTSDSVFHSYCLLIDVLKEQSNTKFCNQFYRNLLSNGARTFLFGDDSDGFYFTLCFLILQLIKSTVWTAHGERHTLSILYFLWIQNRTYRSTKSEWNLWSKQYYYSIVIIYYFIQIAVLQKKSHKSTGCTGKTFWNLPLVE